MVLGCRSFGAGRTLAPLVTSEIVGYLRQSFGLSALVLRDAGGRVLTAVPVESPPASIPETQLTPRTVFSDEGRLRFEPAASVSPMGEASRARH